MEERREPTSADESAAGLRGLVVQTGKAAGAWQPLRSPVTLVGRSAGCDVRIDATGVRALHCLLAPGHDGVSMRAVHTGGVKVNGQAANAAVLRDGDVIAIGPSQFRLRWPALTPSYDPTLETLRIQAAAVVAQQSALFEQELTLRERETALQHQEGQLAEHLEDKRRQLLHLQDQITEARENLRQKRSAHEALIAEQDRALATARDETAENLVHVKAERQRLTGLLRKLKERWRRERHAQRAEFKDEWARLREANDAVERERSQSADRLERLNTEIELDKRRLRDAWQRLHAERKGWIARKAGEEAELRLRLHDIAERDKAVRASEVRFAAERDRIEGELQHLRKESEYLETRIGHGRERLLKLQADAVAPARPPAADTPIPPAEHVPEMEDERTRRLAHVALELSDQRLWLAEQLARFNSARDEWHSERKHAGEELDRLTASLAVREQDASRRSNDVAAAEQRLQSESEALVQSRLRQEAERARADTRHVQKLAELQLRADRLTEQAAALDHREARLDNLLRTWGQRRRQAIESLEAATQASREERTEWAAARADWLRELEKIAAERRDLAARQLALEQVRAEWLADPDRSPAAQKRLERLERQWETSCGAALRDLMRLRATLEAESARLDRAADESRLERRSAILALAEADERLAQADAARLAADSEQSRAAERAEHEREGRIVAETHVSELQDEVESLARLLIDSPRPVDRAA